MATLSTSLSSASGAATVTDQDFSVLRVVTLGSATGKYGGPYDTARRQVDLMHARGVRCRLLAGHLRGDRPTHPLVETVHVRRWVPIKDYAGLLSWRYLRMSLRAVRAADVVHVSISRELIPFATSAMAILLGRPLVLQPHGMLTSRSSRVHRALDPLVRATMRRADAVVALTEIESKALQAWMGKRRLPLHVIGNPSPEIHRSLRTNSRPFALFAARLHARKRVADFIEAARLADANDDCIDYQVAGPDQGDLHVVTDAVAKVSSLSYVGALSQGDLNLRLSEAAVLVLPSHNEPWGNVLVCAIKAGIPVVVTRSAALASDVHELNLGRVVPDGDPTAIRVAVADLARRVISHPKVVEDAIDERFGNDEISSKLFEVYSSPQGRDLGESLNANHQAPTRGLQ